ncbi:hypothetical protein HPB50_004349 [Hyalomma asiaticum]|uniref:Uncharacterized protein n=1 Tax=Hyalomma asiaticum TaxID=266040 RepID=A0ACB7SHZ7_HYAAI|nr:hypothetical protein HPB50_004349 [Hyalomma asiaticum]
MDEYVTEKKAASVTDEGESNVHLVQPGQCHVHGGLSVDENERCVTSCEMASESSQTCKEAKLSEAENVQSNTSTGLEVKAIHQNIALEDDPGRPCTEEMAPPEPRHSSDLGMSRRLATVGRAPGGGAKRRRAGALFRCLEQRSSWQRACMPWRREAAMQQIGQVPPMTQEQEVRTAQTPPCANGPNGSARQDGSGPPPLQQRKSLGDKPLSSELLETLRRECLERSVCTRVARLPSVIEKAPQPIKLEPSFFKTEDTLGVFVPKAAGTASSRNDKSHLRSPSRTFQQSVHQQNHHQRHNQLVKSSSVSVKHESVRDHANSDTELRGPRSSPACTERSQRRSSTDISSPAALQSAAQSLHQQQRHHQQAQRHSAAKERLQGEGDMVCKKEDSEIRANVAKCNYVLSDNYENLSGDESPASRSLEASNVDQKAIELFLPLVDAMEGRRQNDNSAAAAVIASEEYSESACDAADDYDDLPEEGSLVIDDEGVDGEPSAQSGVAVANTAGAKKVVSGTRLKWSDESPTAVTPDSPQEGSVGSPASRADHMSTSRSQSVDDVAEAASRWQLLRDLKNKKSKLGLLRKSTSGDSSRGDDSGAAQPPPLTPVQGDSPPPSARRPGRRSNPRPGTAATSGAGDANQDDRAGGATRLGSGRLSVDDRGDGASTPTGTTPPLRNGPRKRSRWKASATQEDEDAGGAETGSNADYQPSSDEDTSKSCSDQPTPPPLPPPAQGSHLGKMCDVPLKRLKVHQGLLRKSTSGDSSRGDDSGAAQPPPLTPVQGDSPPPSARRPGRRSNPRPGTAATTGAGDANQDDRAGGATRLGSGRLSVDDRGDGASTPTGTTPPLRNGPRKRSRWKASATQEDEDAGGAETGSNADYQPSSDEDTSKSCSDQPTPPPLPPPAQGSHLGGKKQRKNSEDNHRRGSSSSLSGEQHGDESRYKRLAQELPGFNWLEQKIMGHGGGNFADASPSTAKHVTREAPIVVPAPAAERTEQKGTTPPQESKRVYPPGTDILSRSMSEIQDDCCEEDVGDEAPVMEASVIAAPEEERTEDDGRPQEMVQQEIPREILVTALPDTYTTDPRLSQVITSTALIRQQYPLEVHMAGQNTALELPIGAPRLTSTPMLTCVPQGIQEVEAESRRSPKSQAEAIPQGRAAPEEQSSDSDVLYLGVSRKSLSPGSENSGGDHRNTVPSESGKAADMSRSADNNGTQAAVGQKVRAGAPEPINLSDASRRSETYGTPREHYSFFQPHQFSMADHQRWLDERRYQEMMNSRGTVVQQRHLPPSQISPELSQRRLSGGPQILPSRMEAPQQYRPLVPPERSPTLRQLPPSHQGPLSYQAVPQHQPTSSHQPQLSHQPSHQSQITQLAAQSHQTHFSHQLQPSHQTPPSHQTQLLHQTQLSHQMPISRAPQQMHPASSYYPLPRAHQAPPGGQPLQQLPALTRDTPPRNGRPELYQSQQRYKSMEQTYGVSPHAQQMGAYAVPQLPKQSPDPAAKTMSPPTGNPYMKDGKTESAYKETSSARSERPGPGAPPTGPVNAKPPSSSPHTQRPESAGHSSQTSSLKTEMEMLKDELKYLDALAAQKEAEYEKVVQTRAEKLKTLNQLEARYKRSLEQPQQYPKDDLRYSSAAADVRQGPSPASSLPEKTASLVEDPKAVPRQRPSSVGGAGQQKPSPPSMSSPLAKPPGHQAVPGLIPYPLPHPPQQTRPPLSLASHANIPLNMPLMGAGMFSMRNMELQRDFGPMLGSQPLNSSLIPGYGRPYYPLDRSKHPTLHPMEAPKPALKRKYSAGSVPSLPQSNGEMRSASQRPTMTSTGQRQREPEKVTAPLSQEHMQWLHAMKSREAQVAQPGYPAGVQSAFQTYGSFPNRRVLPEDLPLNPAMSNAAWSNYAEGLHEQYALQMAKHGLYPGHPAWSGSDKQQQRSGDAAGAAMLGRELPAKRPSREEPVIHQMPKDRHMMRPGDKPVAHAASLGSQAPPQEQALSAQSLQAPQNPPSKNNTCVLCGQHAQFMCSGCQNIWYCGPQCQRNHWVSHSSVCMGSKR